MYTFRTVAEYILTFRRVPRHPRIISRSVKVYDIGYNEVEEFWLGLKYNFKSGLQSKDDAMIEVVQVAMKMKRNTKRELINKRNKHRREMQKKLGKNSKTYRKEIKDLRDAARQVKEDLKRKYEKKVEHLRGKYRKEKEDRDDEVPAELGEYFNLSIFSRKRFEEIVPDDYEIKCLGELDLHENEKKLMKLHTKFSVTKKLD